ncbi:MAG TPA: M23 family metallopeptidase [Microbacterium sp.]|nr:M23 family metallopeptidase [Microbacterium sp.]
MRPQNRRRTAGVLLLILLLLPAPAAGVDTGSSGDALPSWVWPVATREVVAPFRAPAHEYGAGHRGVDIAAAPGEVVHSPADGIVAFRGTVVDRPLLTIDHGSGLVTTFEPLASTLNPGDLVAAGDEIGTVDVGGHARPGTLHLGVRLDGEYINPMLLFGDVPRAVLLPCCAPL